MRAILGSASFVLSLLLLGLAGVVIHGKGIIVVKPLPGHQPTRGHGHGKRVHKHGSPTVPIDRRVPIHFVPGFGVNHPAKGGTPGDFGLYIFAMSWKAEWCHHSHYPGCEEPHPSWETGLTIHGLWPDHGDGSYPVTCSAEAFDYDRVVGAVGLEALEESWPNVEVPEDDVEEYDSFWQHEWSKHGTCSGLSQEEYFTTALSILTDRYPTPAVLSERVGSTISRAEIEEGYDEEKVVLQCRGPAEDRYLSQVMLCFNKDETTGGPGDLVACPITVLVHDNSCGHGPIKVASF